MKEPTAEQKAKAQARREKMRALAKEISKLSPDDRAALAAKAAAVMKIDGGTLSPYNQCFLISQKSDVTIVGGFQQWRKAGRKVISGPGSGLAIWIPCGSKTENQETGEKETDGKPEFFTLGTVFDVSQTAEHTAPDASCATGGIAQTEAAAPAAEESKGYAFTPAEVAAAEVAITERPF